MSDVRETAGTLEDKIITSLFLEAEQTQLSHEPVHDEEKTLRRFSSWLDDNIEFQPKDTAQDAMQPRPRLVVDSRQTTEHTEAPVRRSTAATVRVLIAEDMHLMRRGLVALLGNETDIDVIAEVERGDRIVPVALSRVPDVAIIDSEMPGMDGFSAARMLADRLPGCRTLMMTERPRVGDVRRVVAARAYGLVLKETPAMSMANAIRRVARGQKVVDPDLAYAALDAAENPLSTRETEILYLTTLGTPPHEIAEKLCLTVGTVRNYLARIIRKVGARNRVDAIRIAYEEGWI